MQTPFSRRRFLVQGAAALAGASLPEPATDARADLARRKSGTGTKKIIRDLETVLPEQMAREAVPGVSIALIRDGRLAWARGYGIRQKEREDPVTAETLFEAASLSKPVFAYAVQKMSEEGALSLDAPLTDYLPEPYLPDEPRLKQITARRVLGHTTGFPNWRPRGKPLTLNRAPGETFGYSGEGYVYLQSVVERLTGQSLADHMRTSVLEPLAMPGSSYVWLRRYDQQSARGHDREGQPTEKGKPARANAAWSLHTTPTEFARFMIALLRPPRRDQFHLAPGSIRRMLTPHVTVNDALSWGLGWGLHGRDGSESFWHWGDNGSFKCFAAASRRARNGVMVMTNGANGLRICKEVVRVALGVEHPAFAWSMLDL